VNYVTFCIVLRYVLNRNSAMFLRRRPQRTYLIVIYRSFSGLNFHFFCHLCGFSTKLDLLDIDVKHGNIIHLRFSLSYKNKDHIKDMWLFAYHLVFLIIWRNRWCTDQKLPVS